MARIPYADLHNPALAALTGRIGAQRGKVLNLYAMLLNSPPVAEGWLNYLTAIRQKAALPAKIRELMIIRVAVLNGADYEYAQHVPFALKAGCTQAQLDALKQGDLRSFSDAERAALAYCDAMTREIHVSDATFDALRPHFNAQAIVEITATVAAYNMVSRFLEALRIDHDED